MSQQDVRTARRSARRALAADPDVAAAGATDAADRFQADIGLVPGTRIGLYRAHDGELDPLPLERAAEAAGLTVFLPVITGPTLEFAAVSPDTALRPNSFGIDEPATANRVMPGELDLVVVPVVAFDRRGHRLGHGHGYYDRAFAFRLGTESRPALIGYAWDDQEIAEVSNHDADVALDAVVTPTRIIWQRRPATDAAG